MTQEYLVLYRKHRPSAFDELVGQQHIVEALTKAIAMGRIAHAYLFCGPRGVGKTTTARLMAKAIQCEAADANKPCNTCARCDDAQQGRSADLIEIDGASHRGIDEIRELREAVRFVPLQAPRKVYIIDEAHMLTTPAFNALLKTLEEPPRHAVFVLATTEPDRMPATIVSRTQRYDFRRPTVSEIDKRIREIAKRERITLDNDSVQLIALAAEGSFRDAESILGQIMAGGNTKIVRQNVEEILGLPKRETTKELFSCIAKKDAPQALSLVARVMDAGHDPALLLHALLRYVRAALILKVAPELSPMLEDEFLADERASIVAHLAAFTREELATAAQSLAQYQQQFKYTPIPQLPLELAIIELARQ